MFRAVTAIPSEWFEETQGGVSPREYLEYLVPTACLAGLDASAASVITANKVCVPLTNNYAVRDLPTVKSTSTEGVPVRGSYMCINTAIPGATSERDGKQLQAVSSALTIAP